MGHALVFEQLGINIRQIRIGDHNIRSHLLARLEGDSHRPAALDVNPADRRIIVEVHPQLPGNFHQGFDGAEHTAPGKPHPFGQLGVLEQGISRRGIVRAQPQIHVLEGESRFELCVVEAVTNAIEHAYHCELGHQVRVVLNLHPDRAEIEVRDQGNPMDSSLLQEAGYAKLDLIPDDVELLSVRGRGLSIMKEMMDAVSYWQDGAENCLVLTKRLRPQSEDESNAVAGQDHCI